MALLSPHDPDDLIFEHLAGAPDGFYSAPLPDSFSLRTADLVARDQKTRGTCVAFAAAVLAKLVKKACIDLSPEWIYRLRTNPRTEGMHARNALQILQRVGIVSEASLPYRDNDKPIILDQALYTEASLNRLDGFSRITTQDGLKRSLLETRVPLVAIVEHYNSSAVFWRPDYAGQSVGYHAVSIVGYSPEGVQLLNSWGPTWADDGYSLIPWDDWSRVREIWAVSE